MGINLIIITAFNFNFNNFYNAGRHATSTSWLMTMKTMRYIGFINANKDILIVIALSMHPYLIRYNYLNLIRVFNIRCLLHVSCYQIDGMEVKWQLITIKFISIIISITITITKERKQNENIYIDKVFNIRIKIKNKWDDIADDNIYYYYYYYLLLLPYYSCYYLLY